MRDPRIRQHPAPGGRSLALRAVTTLAARCARGRIGLAVLRAAASLTVECAASAVIALLKAAPFFAVHDALDLGSIALLTMRRRREARAPEVRES